MTPLGLRHLAAAMLAAVGLLSCGASIRGTYEGDVRFEHCMALDARPDMKPTIRRACWEEWLSFYTFGQTRDRIDHARLRARQLGAASDFDEGERSPVAAAAAPDPTSAIAPPPLMVAAADGGAPPADGGAPAPTDTEGKVRDPFARCTAECDEGLESCR